MSKQKRLSAYTPSNMDPEQLKRIFVQREKLLDLIVNRLTASMTSGDKHHILLVGPRGSGKTHLVTLAVWALRQKPELSDTMRIAWLGEDDVFSGLVHFAFAIAKSLADEYPQEFPEDFKSGVRGLPLDDAAIAVLNTVIKNLKKRHLLLVTENLDQTFSSLGDIGQKKLRAFLQETRRIATLSTSQQLFAGVSSRKEAFFGFFDTHHLEPLTVDDALQLIRKIAVEQENAGLVRFLDSTHARYRIRAIHHLAGGNYRMYVLLAEFLTKDTLDELISAFEALAEEMTPYFQERMRSLPDQQRQLVQCLCNATGALTVKEIMEETFIAEGNCSKQLGHLKAKGYVRSEKRGKESYYDMAEPLMRLCLEVKNQRGRPLRLVAQFLKAWFPEDKLQSSLKPVGINSRSADYCRIALQADNTFEKIIISKLRVEINQKLQSCDYHQALALADELSVAEPAGGLLFRAEIFHKKEDWKSEISALTDVLSSSDADIDQKAQALVNRGVTHGQMGDTKAAVADYTAVIELPDVPVEKKARALVNRGVTHGQMGDTKAAVADCTAVIELPGVPVEQKARALVYRGVTHGQLGDTKAAVADCTAVIELPGVPVEQKSRALVNRGVTHGQLGDTKAAVADCTAVIELPGVPVEQKARALVNRGVTHGQMGDTKAAVADYTAVIELPAAPIEQKARALFFRGVTHGQLGDTKAALADCTAVIELSAAPVEQKAQALFFRGMTHGRLGDTKAALADYTAVIELPDAPIEQKARALVNRGVAHGELGDLNAALVDYTAVIELPNAPIEQKARALDNRGRTHGHMGDTKASLADYTAVIELPAVPIDQKAQSLVNRGLTHGHMGDTKAALADFTAVIELPNAPIEQKARALVNRGVAHGELGDLNAALADYTAVIELPAAPVEQKAQALFNRGATYWRIKNWQACINDFEAVLDIPNVSSDLRTQAMFAVPEPMISICTLQQVIEALLRAFENGDKESEYYGGTPNDLLSMILERGPADWAAYVFAIAPLYIQHGVAAKLGEGLTRTIQVLDEKDFSPSQLDLWNQAWQKVGKDCDDLQIPLTCVDAAVEILKSDVPTDRPLFRLPLEVRQLVRPLLKKTLPED